MPILADAVLKTWSTHVIGLSVLGFGQTKPDAEPGRSRS